MNGGIIVTGAAGFIGRNVVAALNRRGYDDLLLVDRLGRDEKWKNLIGLRFEEFLSPQDFLSALRGGGFPDAQVCIHLGACTDTMETDADFLLENNYRYTRTLCEWAMKHGVRFVYASSAATYGDGSRGYRDDNGLTEGLTPLNMYGHSKQMFDLWAMRHEYFRHIVGLKYFNVYGPFEDHKGNMRSLVQKAYHQILDRGYIELFRSYRPEYRDGEQRRDFVYVHDAVAVTLHFALESGESGLFNCGTGQSRTWLDLANALFGAMNRHPDIRFIDMPEALRGKYQYFTQADTGKLRKAGCTKPFTSLEDGVRDYVQTYLEPRNPPSLAISPQENSPS